MIDCVVVGGGPAGLAASAALSGRGIAHLVLERGRVGETWRTQRWDSLRLNNPGWMNEMLGAQPPNSYLTVGKVVERLEKLAAPGPVREGVRVHRRRRFRANHRKRNRGGPCPHRGGGDRWGEHATDAGAGPSVSRWIYPAPFRGLTPAEPIAHRGRARGGQRPVRLPDHRGPAGRGAAGRAGRQPSGCGPGRGPSGWTASTPGSTAAPRPTSPPGTRSPSDFGR